MDLSRTSNPRSGFDFSNPNAPVRGGMRGGRGGYSGGGMGGSGYRGSFSGTGRGNWQSSGQQDS
eukprot:884739-Rhodomonas_salina.1